MNLEKLVLGTAIALSSLGCTTYTVIKRPPKLVPMPLKPIAEVVKVQEAPKNYSQIRFANGVYALYDTTFSTPESKLNEEEKTKEIEKRISYISSHAIIENSGKELNKEKLSSKNLPINLPKDKKATISVLEECLNAKKADANNFYRSLCRVASVDEAKASGYGIILGEDYILTPASLIYPALIAKELKRDQRISISELEELKEKEETIANYANLLAINPLKDLALLELIDSKKKHYWRIPIIKNKKLEEVTVYTDSTLRFLESDAKLEEKELIWRFNAQELKAAQALNFSFVTIKTQPILTGSGIYNKNGLVGIIAGKPEVEYEKESINTLVTNSNLIREFLEDYINFLRSGSDNLENLTKTAIIVPKAEPTIKQDPTEQPQAPKKDITNYILGLYGSLLALSIGKYFYDKFSPKEEKEEFELRGNIQGRIKELKNWLEEQKEIEEAALQVQTMHIDRTIPPTSENVNAKSQLTIDGYEDEESKNDKRIFPQKLVDAIDRSIESEGLKQEIKLLLDIEWLSEETKKRLINNLWLSEETRNNVFKLITK